ncbi:hypothetical protein NPIL_642311 [Nephila pilipes]|uniref:Uncharacterized protein n=1 Tax=Nephila pilipes TaxID=299642 RepID=A0A8X6PSB7_NEPPI|nr:hypothetical protein NPIL_642311 [Nephila pilipes]
MLEHSCSNRKNKFSGKQGGGESSSHLPREKLKPSRKLQSAEKRKAPPRYSSHPLFSTGKSKHIPLLSDSNPVGTCEEYSVHSTGKETRALSDTGFVPATIKIKNNSNDFRLCISPSRITFAKYICCLPERSDLWMRVTCMRTRFHTVDIFFCCCFWFCVLPLAEVE